MARVLIVDDEPSSRQVLHDMLVPEGYLIQIAGSAAEALEIAPTCAPDVILTDLMMPEVDGLELCRRLRAVEATRSTPIIVVTALNTRMAMPAAIEAGATDFITKPVNGIEVRSRVRSMLRVGREQRTLQELLQLRTDLTNMVIHDLRNPLQSITFSVDYLQRRHQDANGPLLRIRNQVSRLQQLIDDLLVVARSEAGVLVAHRSEVDLRAFIGVVIEDCLAAAQAAEIEIVVRELDNGSISMDAALMRRCLENVLLNAVKFSPKGSRIELSVVQTQEDLSIDVLDEGPGVPEELRQSIFERFAVGSKVQDHGVPQIGLGLAFCRMVVEAHAGTIVVLPRETKGSVFRIWLPVLIAGSEIVG